MATFGRAAGYARPADLLKPFSPVRKERTIRGAMGTVFPPSSEEVLFYDFVLSLARYLEEKAARVSAEPALDRAVKVNAASHYITVEHEATVRIVNDKGQSFQWTADTWGKADVPLRAIAPRDFAAGATRVFVYHPYEHTIDD